MHPESNAPAGYPDVSPEGYPLFYPIGEGGKPAGKPMLRYAGQSFESALEIEQFKQRIKRRDENLEKWRQEWLAKYHTGPLSADEMRYSPARYYLRQKADEYTLAGKGDLFEKVLFGTNTEIAWVKNLSVPVPASFHVSLVDPAVVQLIDDIANA